MKRNCFLPECTVLRSRLNSRNKYKVHLQTFIHARLQQPPRCPPPCWCMPAERWNGEKNGGFPSFPQREKQERWRTDRLWECQCRCVRGLWWVQSEGEGQTLTFTAHVPGKWSRRGRRNSPSLNDYPIPGISVQDGGFSRSSLLFALREEKLDVVHSLCIFQHWLAMLGEGNRVAYLKVSSDKIK